MFTFCYLAEAFIQSNLKMRIEAIKTNKRAIICNKVLYWYIIVVLYFNFTKKRAAFCPSNNRRTLLIIICLKSHFVETKL